MKRNRDYYFKAPLGLHLSNIAKQYLGVLNRKLTDIEVERYFFPLVAIGEAGGRMTQQQLADILSSDKVTMVRVVDYLSKGGFVKRKQNKADRREYFLELTEKGAQCIPDIRKAISEANKETFAGIPEEKMHEFYQVLEKLACNLSVLPAEKVDFRYKRLK